MNNKNPFVVSCEIASLLIEKKLSNALTLGEKRQLFIHNLICKACRNYEKQSRLLENILRKKIGAEPDTFKLSTPQNSTLERFKLQIIRIIDKK